MCQSLPHSRAMNRATADVVRTQRGVITRSQALQGYTPEQIRARLAGGRWVRVFRGVYRAASAEPTARLRVVWTMIYATARHILSVPDELIAQLAYALGVTR